MGGMWQKHSEQSVQQYHSLGGQLTIYECMCMCVCVCVCVCFCLFVCLNLVRANATVILSRCFAFTFGVFSVYQL